MERDFFPNIIGNKRLKGIISSDISNGRTAHAYIIEGPSGSGKMLTALSICAAEVCERKNDGSSPLPCGECDSCKRILSGLSADVLVTKKPEDKASLEKIQKRRQKEARIRVTSCLRLTRSCC